MQPVVIGIAGGSGSGKTTVAEAILERVGHQRIAIVSHDAYYRDETDKPFEERLKTNYDHPDSLETELMVEQLKQLRAGRPIEMPVYDFTQYRRGAETRRVEPQPVIIVEGILIFVDRAVRDLCDAKIFVDVDADLRLIRRLKRDVYERRRALDSILQQYLDTVRPMHLEFVEPSKRYADIILPGGGFNTVGLDLIAARVRDLLDA